MTNLENIITNACITQLRKYYNCILLLGSKLLGYVLAVEHIPEPQKKQSILIF